MEQKQIIISGGGICGLACALAASQAGYSVQVLEKSATSEKLGAGLQLGPNAVRALQALGAWDAVSVHCRSPSHIQMMDAKSGKTVRQVNLGEFETKYGAPYRVIHRADLHQSLLACALKDGKIDVQLGQAVVEFSEDANGVRVNVEDGSEINGIGFIAADGIGSPSRRLFQPTANLVDHGMVFHRAELVPGKNDDAVRLWMGPNCHMVQYDVGQAALRNLIFITQKNVSPRDAALSLCDDVQSLVADVKSWTAWPSLSVQPSASWSTDRSIMLGDAAHGTLPFLAQGAAMALEDAAWLLNSLRAKNDIAQAFSNHKLRLIRTKKLHNASLRQGKIYHLSGPTAVARNLALATMPEFVFSKQLNWIYSHEEGQMKP